MGLLTATALTTLATIFRTSSAGSWNDGHGPIDDGFFSVVFSAEPSPYGGEPTPETMNVWIQDYQHTKNNGGVFNDNNLCNSNVNAGLWWTYDSFLPYTVDILAGYHWCYNQPFDTWGDTHVEYAGWKGQVYGCSKCGVLPDGVTARCIIPLEPNGGC